MDQGQGRYTLMQTAQKILDKHIQDLLSCDRCPAMYKPVISGGAVLSKVMLVGQAPGIKEPQLQRPFAHTAGKTLFRWFQDAFGIDEARFRSRIYIAAVCRCYPGKNPKGGDRVPDKQEIANCASWLSEEIKILQPELILPVGKLAIQQFTQLQKLIEVIGRKSTIEHEGHHFDIVPLPHPSGASTWHRMEPGVSLLREALTLIGKHPAFQSVLP